MKMGQMSGKRVNFSIKVINYISSKLLDFCLHKVEK